MFRNVASQKLTVYAFDATTNLPKTGDANNLTAYLSKDYGALTVLGDASATEVDATNAKGYYQFDLTQTETNATTILFTAKSSTANVVVRAVPDRIVTYPQSFSLIGIDGTGHVDADVKQILNQAVPDSATPGKVAINFGVFFAANNTLPARTLDQFTFDGTDILAKINSGTIDGLLTSDALLAIGAAVVADPTMTTRLLSAIAAAKMERATRCMGTGTVGSGSTTTTVVIGSQSPAKTTGAEFKDRLLIFPEDTTTAVLRGAFGVILTGGSNTEHLLDRTLPAAPVSGDTYSIN